MKTFPARLVIGLVLGSPFAYPVETEHQSYEPVGGFGPVAGLSPTSVGTGSHSSFTIDRSGLQAMTAISYVSPPEQISVVRDALGLNVSTLAGLLGTSRPTIYAWSEGQEPNPDHQQRLLALFNLAKLVEQMEIPRMDAFMKRPIFDGRSILELLQDGLNVSEHLPVIKKLAIQEQESRSVRKWSLEKQRDYLEDISTPAFGSE